MKNTKFALGLLAVLLCGSAGDRNGEVKMREGTITLPAYQVYAPEKAPLFERDFT